MWSRSLTKQMGDPEIFVQGLIAALTNEKVVKKFQECLTDPLKFDISKLQEEFNGLKADIQKCTQTNTELKQEVKDLTDLINSKDNQIAQLTDRIQTLEIQVDEQEQYTRSNSLRVSGLSEKADDKLMDRFLTMTNVQMKVSINADDVERIHRVGQAKPGHTRGIIVKMKSHESKTKVLKARRNLGKRKEQRDEDPDQAVEIEGEEDVPLTIPEDYSNIYINEDLTRTRSHLLWIARQKKRSKVINDCWSFNGKIMIKDKANVIKQIKCESDFLKFL